MTVQPAPKVFLSHSHRDKRVARRLVRSLTAHGIKVWIDERELRVGTTLTPSIRSQIEDSNMLLVIASQASAGSKWVGLELDFAREQGKEIIPFLIEPLAEHERFRDHLGVDATSPQAVADVVHDLMRNLLLAFDFELPAANPALLTVGLRELAREEPDLAPLINGCLDSKGLHFENLDTVCNAAFHSLDYALNSLFDLSPNDTMASHAAYGFNRAGAGVRALSSYIAVTGDGAGPLVTTVGQSLERALIPTAIKLLEACDPPNNHALYMFIHQNAAELREAHRGPVIRLVTWPIRSDTDRQGDVLGWVAIKHFPDAREVQQMWTRWVRAGVFDGKPRDLARYLAEAHKEKLPGWEDVNEALRSHVRGYLRSRDKNKVVIAVNHLKAAADAGAPVLASLLREATGVAGTAEWDMWRESDPDTAEWMGWYVFEFAEQAATDRDWLRAWDSTQRTVEFERERLRVLTQDKQDLNGDE